MLKALLLGAALAIGCATTAHSTITDCRDIPVEQLLNLANSSYELRDANARAFDVIDFRQVGGRFCNVVITTDANDHYAHVKNEKGRLFYFLYQGQYGMRINYQFEFLPLLHCRGNLETDTVKTETGEIVFKPRSDSPDMSMHVCASNEVGVFHP